MIEKISKVISVFKKDGFGVAFGKVTRYIKTLIKKNMGIKYKFDFKKNRGSYESLINEALTGDFDRVLIWRSSFGWNVPLYQRPQHMSTALSKNKCLVFYEVTSMTDNVTAIAKQSDGLYLVNFDNSKISALLFSKLDEVTKPKYLQFYSTDWTMSVDYVKSFKDRGYKILYEYIDDIDPQLAGTKELPKNIAEKYKWAMSSPDDVLVVVTAGMIEKDVLSKRGNKNLVFAANGVDYDFFRDLSNEPEFDEEFKEVLKSGKPLVGYYGAMARWLDYDLIKKINDINEFTVVLFGIRYDDSLDNSGILGLENVKFIGPRDYKVLKYYASKLDILTIPFVINDITRATSPLKLFEYMALHKPIVTSAMDECIKCSTPLIAYNHEQFIEMLREAYKLRNDVSLIDNMDKEARENSWTAKAEAVISLLKNSEQ